MMTIKTFEDLKVWKKSRLLAREVYGTTARRGFVGARELRSQMRKSVLSIMSNIAEGFERDGNREFQHFLSMAKGSSGELRSQLYVALDQGYLSRASFREVHSLATEVGRLICGLMKYLRHSPLRGRKFTQSE